MAFGRFAVIVPVLAIAGSLAAKKKLAATSGTLPTHGPLFVTLVVGAVVVFGALTYLPTLALGPIAEHLRSSAEPFAAPFPPGPETKMARRQLSSSTAPSWAGRHRFLPQARSAHPGPQPGDVRGLAGQRRWSPCFSSATSSAASAPTRRPPPPGLVLRRRGGRSGCGSPCFSPTCPRPWPKAAQGPGRHPARAQAVDRQARRLAAPRQGAAEDQGAGRAAAARRRGASSRPAS